jgi:hypothetical protein
LVTVAPEAISAGKGGEIARMMTLVLLGFSLMAFRMTAAAAAVPKRC